MTSQFSHHRITVAMLGARRHYAVPRLLHEAGRLDLFFTDSYIGNKRWLQHAFKSIPYAMRPSLVNRWLGRQEASLPNSKVKSFDALGIWYAVGRSRNRLGKGLDHVYVKAAQRFNSRIIRQRGFENAECLWGFNGASLELFEAAKRLQIPCILEQTSNPMRIARVLAEVEHQRRGEWLSPDSHSSMSTLLEHREEQEWCLADRIVAGSQFVGAGLRQCGVPESKIHVVPYGIDLNRFRAARGPASFRPDVPNAPLRVLFVGRVSVMKGVVDLLEALAELGPSVVEARLVGSVSLDRRLLTRYTSVATTVGHVPRPAISEHYNWADLFCFPSITEGSAAVTYEALASGLPVITTPNAGSMVDDGIDGTIIPIRDPQALACAMLRYHENRQFLSQQSDAAFHRREKTGLNRYRRDLIRFLSEP